MKWVIISLIILAVVAAVALIAIAMKRKKDQAARERASELRSEAAQTASTTQEQEARAREASAEAERVRAQADKLDARAEQERTSYDMTRAQQEDALREADQLDPDVDHSSPEYRPDVEGGPSHRGEANEPGTRPHSTGPANPVPPGPETTPPRDAAGDPRNDTVGHEDDLAAWEREQERRDQI